jgi:transposase
VANRVIVAHARNVRLIGESRRKDDRLDAQTLARLARIDPQLLCPVKHRSAQADLSVIRARAGLVRARTALVNTARGLAKSYGERLRGCNVRNMNPEKAESLSPELQRALEPLLAGIESLSERIREYNERIEGVAQESYPQVALLKQVKGVGTLIALTFLLTLEDAHRFRKSRDVGCYLGLQPGRRNSGQSEPQMHISKEGDPYLRTFAGAGCAPHSGTVWSRQRPAALGPETGRAWREEREETGHHRHRAKVGRVAASFVGKRRNIRTIAEQQTDDNAGSSVIKKIAGKEKYSSNAEFR